MQIIIVSNNIIIYAFIPQKYGSIVIQINNFLYCNFCQNNIQFNLVENAIQGVVENGKNKRTLSL